MGTQAITETDARIAERTLITSEPIEVIARNFGLTKSFVEKMLKEKFGITGRNRYRYRAEIVRRRYATENEHTLGKLLKMYSLSKTAYDKYLLLLKSHEPIQKVKYEVDSNYFHEIDTEEKAYWLGFIMADGTNDGSKVEISIQKTDVNHLRKFRRAIRSTHLIRYEKSDDTARIAISDKAMAQDLDNVGVIKNKTYYGHVPKYHALPRYLVRHYVRGYFDGNGNMSKLIHQELTSINSLIRRIKKVCLSINHRVMADEMADMIRAVTGMTPSVYETSGRACEVYLEGEDNVRRFLDFMYKDATVYLDRKYSLYLRYILPSDLEIDRIIREKLSEETLPKLDYDHL